MDRGRLVRREREGAREGIDGPLQASGHPYLDDDRPGLAQLVPVRVGVAGETPAGPAAWTVALTVALAEDVLGCGGRVARLGEEAARGGSRVAVSASSFVAAAVFGDGGFVCLAGY